MSIASQIKDERSHLHWLLCCCFLSSPLRLVCIPLRFDGDVISDVLALPGLPVPPWLDFWAGYLELMSSPDFLYRPRLCSLSSLLHHYSRSLQLVLCLHGCCWTWHTLLLSLVQLTQLLATAMLFLWGQKWPYLDERAEQSYPSSSVLVSSERRSAALRVN